MRCYIVLSVGCNIRRAATGGTAVATVVLRLATTAALVSQRELWKSPLAGIFVLGNEKTGCMK
jgi:hypothetical protein